MKFYSLNAFPYQIAISRFLKGGFLRNVDQLKLIGKMGRNL